MRAAVSKPSMPGIFTSSSTTANSCFISASSASRPEFTATRLCPSGSRMARYVSSRAGWSSTSRMFAASWPWGIGAGSLLILFAFSGLQPHANQRQQLVGVDGFGDVIGCAGLQALLAVALHGLGGQRDDGQQPECRNFTDAPHGLVAI